jgi:hypothetical protein
MLSSTATNGSLSDNKPAFTCAINSMTYRGCLNCGADGDARYGFEKIAALHWLLQPKRDQF